MFRANVLRKISKTNHTCDFYEIFCRSTKWA